jgi:hypothetical protein
VPISAVFPPSAFCSRLYTSAERQIRDAPVTVVLTRLDPADFPRYESLQLFMVLIYGDAPFVHDACVLERDFLVDRGAVALTRAMAGFECVLTAEPSGLPGAPP